MNQTLPIGSTLPLDFVGTLVEGEPIHSLRDIFAGRAMQAYLSGADRDSFTSDEWAAAAYDVADAMMRARVA